MKSKHPAVLAPLIPLSFVLAYQYDMSKGNKMERIVGMSLSVVVLSFMMLNTGTLNCVCVYSYDKDDCHVILRSI